MWWAQCRAKLERISNLLVFNLPVETTRALAKLAQRNMQLHCTIQDGQIWLANNENTVPVELHRVKDAAH